MNQWGINMNYLELIKNRYSCRNYDLTEIPQEDIDYILECIRLAPSAANRQPWKVYLVKNEGIKAKVAKAYAAEWLSNAPYIIVFTGNKNINWKRVDGEDYLMGDVTIIADHLINAATEKGLGTCWIAAFNEQCVIEALNLSENEKPIYLTPLGYAADDSRPDKKRKDLIEICKLI